MKSADDWQNGWLWVAFRSLTFSLEIRDGKVVEAAPVARRRSMGRSVLDILEIYHGAIFKWHDEEDYGNNRQGNSATT